MGKLLCMLDQACRACSACLIKQGMNAPDDSKQAMHKMLCKLAHGNTHSASEEQSEERRRRGKAGRDEGSLGALVCKFDAQGGHLFFQSSEVLRLPLHLRLGILQRLVPHRPSPARAPHKNTTRRQRLVCSCLSSCVSRLSSPRARQARLGASSLHCLLRAQLCWRNGVECPRQPESYCSALPKSSFSNFACRIWSAPTAHATRYVCARRNLCATYR
jgi:hypothetical protein